LASLLLQPLRENFAVDLLQDQQEQQTGVQRQVGRFVMV
jgi:hypothetical protein